MTTTQIRYALIETGSGFVWWVGEAADPIDACRKADREIDPSEAAVRTYREVTRYESTHSSDGGYLVFEVPAGFDVDNGQDSAEIEAVEAHRCVAAVRPELVSDESLQ